MTGVAVKVTELAGQIVVADAEIDTEGVTVPTFIVMILLVAVAGETQVALLVRMTFTWSLLTNELVVNVLLLVPAFTPFTCH